MSTMALRTLLLGLSLCGTAIASTPAESANVLNYEDGDPIPPGYRVRTQPRRGLVITGAALGGAAYGFAVMGAVDTGFEDKSGFLLIPLVGPWLMLATGGAQDETCPADADECEDENNQVERAVLVLDGLAQATGVTLLALGFAFPRQRLELAGLDVEVELRPTALGHHGHGVAFVGAF